jgi:hypothetical protein
MKQIKISGCHECDKKDTFRVLHCAYKGVLLQIDKQVFEKTIHPDCPLDDMDEQGGWISVDERLPEEWQRVLFVVKLTFSCFIVIRNYHSVTMNESLTHWQPLPDKPKEGF